jgi:hypothetical protein
MMRWMDYFTIFELIDKKVLLKDIELILISLKGYRYSVRFIDNGIFITISSNKLFTKHDVAPIVNELFEFSRITFKDYKNDFWIYRTNGVEFDTLEGSMQELLIKILI